MKKKYYFTGLCTLLIAVSACQSTKVVSDAKVQETTVTSYPLNINFEVEDSSMDRYAGLNYSRQGLQFGRNILGDGYYVKLNGDRVSVVLPFYGETSIVNGYNPPELVLEDRILENVSFNRYQDPREFTLRFEVKKLTRRYRFELHVRPDKTAYINVHSAQNPVAGYSGTVRNVL